jgi:hypothetical protein
VSGKAISPAAALRCLLRHRAEWGFSEPDELILLAGPQLAALPYIKARIEAALEREGDKLDG